MDDLKRTSMKFKQKLILFLCTVEIPEEWEIVPREKLEFVKENGIDKELGVGSFGVVYEGKKNTKFFMNFLLFIIIMTI